MMPFTAPESYVGGVTPPASPVPTVCASCSSRLCCWSRATRPARNCPGTKNLPGLVRPRCAACIWAPWASALAYAFEYGADTQAPQGMLWQGLRALYGRLDDSLFALAGRALQYVDWDRTHQFCGRCGTPTVHRSGERARECPACALIVYPRIAPAVMCLIRRGHEILLARSPRFPPGMYSALAGFVEPGESLEQCLAREVLEETGVRIANPRYFASQPWPFPHSLMIAFVADYAGGEITPAPDEIEDAQWFGIDALPKLPNRSRSRAG